MKKILASICVAITAFSCTNAQSTFTKEALDEKLLNLTEIKLLLKKFFPNTKAKLLLSSVGPLGVAIV